jgi:hypothetical protein
MFLMVSPRLFPAAQYVRVFVPAVGYQECSTRWNGGRILVHNKLQMRSSGANERTLSYWKYADAGEYEQGRLN